MVAQVTTFIENRGFGFLTDSSGEQYFFHVTNFLREGAEGKERKAQARGDGELRACRSR
jgi:cold shock CspA family protein